MNIPISILVNMEKELSWQQLFAKLEPILRLGFVDSLEWRASILSLLESYNSKESDYKPYLFFGDKGYTKNLIQSFDETSNVIVMCWSPGQASAFHGHEGSRCFVKVLAGELIEQQVPYPKEGMTHDLEDKPPVEERIAQNQVRYIDDSIGLHKITNKSSSMLAVTLHIYLPAYTKCRIFNEDTKLNLHKSNSCQVTFYSEKGKLM